MASASRPSAASRSSPPSRASVSTTSRRSVVVVVDDEHRAALGREQARHGLAQLVARERLGEELGRAERRRRAAARSRRCRRSRARARSARFALSWTSTCQPSSAPGRSMSRQIDGRRSRQRPLEPRLAASARARPRGRRARGDSASSVASGGSSSITSTRGAAVGARWRARRSAARTRTSLPSPSRALEADAPAVGGHDLVAEREPEARAADLARVGGVDAEELREDVRLLVGRDADAGVADADAREARRAASP